MIGWTFRIGLALAGLAAATACSSQQVDFGQPGTGGQSSGGTAGTGGTGTGGTGGVVSGPVDCSGTFGAPVALLDNGQNPMASPALDDTELELFVVVSTVDGANEHFERAERSRIGQPFGPLAVVPELDAACAQPDELRTVDLSRDGLRAYVSCNPGSGTETLQLFRRPNRTAPFAASGTLGSTLGSSVALSGDELVAYSSGTQVPGPPLVAVRSSLNDPFGPSGLVPGLENTNVVAPDPSDDELVLFGGLGGQKLGWSTRQNTAAPFGAFQTLSVNFNAAGAPHVSHDCRRLYFVGYNPSPQDWKVLVVSR